VLRPSGKNILHKLKEDFIKASRVVMLGAGWWTWQASPFTTTLAENPPVIALAGRIIHDSRAGGYEFGCGPEGVRNFLGIRYRQAFSAALGARCERSEKAKYGERRFAPHEKSFAAWLPIQRFPPLKQPLSGAVPSLVTSTRLCPQIRRSFHSHS
jgi:hypothetical protein